MQSVIWYGSSFPRMRTSRSVEIGTWTRGQPGRSTRSRPRPRKWNTEVGFDNNFTATGTVASDAEAQWFSRGSLRERSKSSKFCLTQRIRWGEFGCASLSLRPQRDGLISKGCKTTQTSFWEDRRDQADFSVECLAQRRTPQMIMICAVSVLSVTLVIGLVLMIHNKRPDPKMALLVALLDCAKDVCTDTDGDCEL
jgi:hypothetical protein